MYKRQTFSWPRLDFISAQTTSFWSSHSNLGVMIDEVAFFCLASSAALNQLAQFDISSTTYAPSLGSGTITLSANSSTALMDVLFVDSGYLYAKSRDSNIVRAYSAAGTGSKSEVTTENITLGMATHAFVKLMFSDSDYFYFGRGTANHMAKHLSLIHI